MKVIAIVALLALLAVCSADVLKRQTLNADCFDDAASAFYTYNISDVCYNSQEEACTDVCYGEVCLYYANNGYSTLCSTNLALSCFQAGATPPVSCQMCFDSEVLVNYFALPVSCNTTSFNAQDFCNVECAGDACMYYNDNGYPTDCRTSVAQFCTNAGETSPTECGALALVTVKEVAVFVILVTAFLVF